MWVMAFFTEKGEPALGISPVIRIRDVEDGTLVVSDAFMTEKGDGFYGYYFDSYVDDKDYVIRCDAVTISGTERYTYAGSAELDVSTQLNTMSTKVDNIGQRTELIKKILNNRLELEDGSYNNWVLYDDDDVTPLLSYSVTDKDDDFISQQPHTPSRRTRGQ